MQDKQRICYLTTVHDHYVHMKNLGHVCVAHAGKFHRCKRRQEQILNEELQLTQGVASVSLIEQVKGSCSAESFKELDHTR